MSEHRKEERRKAMIFTPVYDKAANVLMGYLGDLTLQGALMVSEKPVEISKNFTLAIEFRLASGAPTKRITIPARAAWCKREQDKTYYNTGFEFLEMTEMNKKVIEAVLERYQFVHEIPA
jgi:c-di-GMP-binding flagellar brake protein YcgR